MIYGAATPTGIPRGRIIVMAPFEAAMAAKSTSPAEKRPSARCMRHQSESGGAAPDPKKLYLLLYPPAVPPHAAAVKHLMYTYVF